MWLLVLEVLKIRWKWALGFFLGGGVLGYSIRPEGTAVLGSLVPYCALACVALVGFGGLLGDEREKRNALYRNLPLSTRQVALAKIMIPTVLVTLFLPLALVLWIVFNGHLSLSMGTFALLGINGFLLMALQFLLFWEEFKFYLTDHWIGRILCWLVPLVGGGFVGFFASDWANHVQKLSLTLWFYTGFLFFSFLAYLFFMARKDHTY